MRNIRQAHLYFGLALIGAVGLACEASAQTTPMASTPSTINETQGASTGLGTSHRFHAAAAAQAHCSNDTVVWSPGPQLTYLTPTEAGYGKGHGFYACRGEANDAGFRAQ